jgi:hypothetical protein
MTGAFDVCTEHQGRVIKAAFMFVSVLRMSVVVLLTKHTKPADIAWHIAIVPADRPAGRLVQEEHANGKKKHCRRCS